MSVDQSKYYYSGLSSSEILFFQWTYDKIYYILWALFLKFQHFIFVVWKATNRHGMIITISPSDGLDHFKIFFWFIRSNLLLWKQAVFYRTTQSSDGDIKNTKNRSHTKTEVKLSWTGSNLSYLIPRMRPAPPPISDIKWVLL